MMMINKLSQTVQWYEALNIQTKEASYEFGEPGILQCEVRPDN